MAQEKNKGMDSGQLELLINDLLEQQTANTALLNTLTTKTENLSKKMEQLLDKKSTPNERPTAMEMMLKDVIKNELSAVKNSISELKQKSEMQKPPRMWRVQFFSREGEKRVHRFMVIAVTVISVVFAGYKFAVHLSDSRQALEQCEQQRDATIKALNDAYRQQGINGKRRMDSVRRKRQQKD